MGRGGPRVQALNLAPARALRSLYQVAPPQTGIWELPRAWPSTELPGLLLVKIIESVSSPNSPLTPDPPPSPSSILKAGWFNRSRSPHLPMLQLSPRPPHTVSKIAGKLFTELCFYFLQCFFLFQFSSHDHQLGAQVSSDRMSHLQCSSGRGSANSKFSK